MGYSPNPGHSPVDSVGTVQGEAAVCRWISVRYAVDSSAWDIAGDRYAQIANFDTVQTNSTCSHD